MTLKDISETLQSGLGLKSAPVAVTFSDHVPKGVERVAAVEPAGCGYWRAASEGKSFYTEASDHYNCPIGAHTHAVELPDAPKKELEGMLGHMAELGYIKMEEVAEIPHRDTPFRYASYAPLAHAQGTPDVVLLLGTVRQLMILAEASTSAGVSGELPTMGRPTCAVLPAAISSGKTAASFGCIGNRVYTQAADDEAYFAIPGAVLEKVAAVLGTIGRANTELEKFHRERAVSLSS